MYVVSFGSIVVKVSNTFDKISLYDALIVDEIGLVLEVYSISHSVVTCVAMGGTDRLIGGMKVSCKKKPLTLKFHKNLIGRVLDPLFNVLEGSKQAEINPVSISPRESHISVLDVDPSVKISETGIKAVDMFCPYVVGGKTGIVGGAGVGKEQPVDSLVLTPEGWKKIADLAVGEEICDSEGQMSFVQGLFPQGEKELYIVTLEDGRSVRAGRDHLWQVVNEEGEVVVLSTIQLQVSKEAGRTFAIPAAAPFYMKNTQSVVECSAIGEELLASEMEGRSVKVQSLDDCLKNNWDQRASLIVELLNKRARLEDGKFVLEFNNKETAVFFQKAVWSLGGYCKLLGEDLVQCFCEFLCTDYIFSGLCTRSQNNMELAFKIESIVNVGEKAEMVCIKVSAEDCLYVTDGYVLTHNTTLIMEMIRNMREKDVFTIFAGVGERVREGHLFYNELVEAGLIDLANPSTSDIAIVFGNMDQTPSLRSKAALSSIALAEHIRDKVGKDVLFLMDNVFRYAQAENEISSSLSLIASELGYQPNLFYDMSLLQERIYSSITTKSITGVQAIYVPADDLQDPAVIAIMRHMDSFITLSRDLASQGIFPAIDPLESGSFAISSSILGKRHYEIYKEVRKVLSRYKELVNVINIVGMDNISDEDKLIVARAKLVYNFMTQPLKVTEQFLGCPGEFVSTQDTLDGFERIVNGELDSIDPKSIYMIGALKSAD